MKIFIFTNEIPRVYGAWVLIVKFEQENNLIGAAIFLNQSLKYKNKWQESKF
jgi:hypothetical protein